MARWGRGGGGVRSGRGGRRELASLPREIQFKKRVAPVARATEPPACVGTGTPGRPAAACRRQAGRLALSRR